MPASTAWRTIGSAASSPSAHTRLGPPPKLIIPRQIRDTFKPESPRRRYRMKTILPHNSKKCGHRGKVRMVVMDVAEPFSWVPLAELRTRSSVKWRRYPADVLPLWVAEMDVRLARPIAEALFDVIKRSDTGYPMGTAYAEALDAFARKRWGWDGVVAER